MIDITGGSMKSKAAVALGIFDGVHCGHRKIIKAAVDYSKKGLTPAVFTFPADGISYKHGKPYEFIYGNRQKIDILSRLGAEYIYSPDISDVFEMSGEEFAEKILAGKMNAEASYAVKTFVSEEGPPAAYASLRALAEDSALS